MVLEVGILILGKFELMRRVGWLREFYGVCIQGGWGGSWNFVIVWLEVIFIVVVVVGVKGEDSLGLKQEDGFF